MAATPAREDAGSIVAVLRAADTQHHAPVIDILLEEGIRRIELTLTTAGALDELRLLRSRFGTDVQLGMGTVLTAALAEEAIDAGADFLVTPAVVPSVLDVGVTRGAPVYSGALTPTEVLLATERGASAIKLFPASALAPRYIGELRGPFPGISFMPSGGVAIEDVSEWLAAGASAVSLGGSLTRNALTGDTSGLRERARRAVSLAQQIASP